MTPAPRDELASLRAVKLPRTRELILQRHDQQRLSGLLLAMFFEQSRKQQAKHLFVYLQLDVDRQTQSANEHDSVEAVFDDLRDASLLEHREAALNAIDHQELGRLCSYAISRCPTSGLRACLLRQLHEPEVNAAEAQIGSPTFGSVPPTLVPEDETPDSKRNWDFAEWDDDELEDVQQQCTTLKSFKTVQKATCPKSKRQKAQHPPKKTRNSSQNQVTRAKAEPAPRKPTKPRARKDSSTQQTERATAAPPGHMWSADTIEKAFLEPFENDITMTWIKDFCHLRVDTLDQLLEAFHSTYDERVALAMEKTSDSFIRWGSGEIYVCLNTFLDTSPYTFVWSAGNDSHACDYCITTQRPCVRMLLHDSTYMLCFYPLPEALTHGVKWDGISLWVRS